MKSIWYIIVVSLFIILCINVNVNDEKDYCQFNSDCTDATLKLMKLIFLGTFKNGTLKKKNCIEAWVRYNV